MLMTTLNRLGLILLFIWLPVGLAAQQPSPEAISGCYRLRLGPWEPPLSRVDSAAQDPPREIELTLERGEEFFERGKLLLRPKTKGSRPDRAWAWWEPFSGDSVRLRWTTGFAGSEARLVRRDDSLIGRIRARIDTAAPTPETEIVGERVSCERHFR